MATQFEPEIGQWYKNAEGMSFEVIAVDEDEGIVEIQYFDGALEEIDTESWYELDMEPRQPPEDWSGPFDDLERGDLDEAETAVHPLDWSGPLDALD
jgi:hypothetical protein